ncbi:MAG: hypothetical protein H7831_10820 [Magnetococcus sp. WYHC-3]
MARSILIKFKPMNYLTNYYKNLSEQLEQKVYILSKKLNYLKEATASPFVPPTGTPDIPPTIPGSIPSRTPSLPMFRDPLGPVRQITTPENPRRPGNGQGGGGQGGGGGRGPGGGQGGGGRGPGGGQGGGGQGGGGNGGSGGGNQTPPPPNDGPNSRPPGYGDGQGWEIEKVPGGGQIVYQDQDGRIVVVNTDYETFYIDPNGDTWYWDGDSWQLIPEDGVVRPNKPLPPPVYTPDQLPPGYDGSWGRIIERGGSLITRDSFGRHWWRNPMTGEWSIIYDPTRKPPPSFYGIPTLDDVMNPPQIPGARPIKPSSYPWWTRRPRRD